MRRRLHTLCVPVLAILLMAWGTCPCLYAEVLSGGLISVDTASETGCACSARSGDDDQADGDGYAGDERTASAGRDQQRSKCPCIDTVGTMHELPQVEDQDLHTGGDLCLVSTPSVLPYPVSGADYEDLGAPAGTDPGPKFRSVVLLV